MEKNFIIVGAASGIGRAAARIFAEKGNGLALGDMNTGGLNTLTDEINLLRHRVWSAQVDVTIPSQVESFVEGAVNALGRLDALIYCAGIGFFSPIVDMPIEQWDKVIAVNLNGAFYFAQAVAKQMIRQRSRGCLLFISSIASTHNTNQVSSYCASKAGLNMLVKCLASELGNHRIRANAVMPGVTDTALTAPMLQKERYRKMLKATIPLGRWGQAEEIVALLEFLASDKALYINGQAIVIDGGYTTRQLPDWWPLNYTNDHEVNWYDLFSRYPYK
ncbi:MAG: SDR family oxidoreductase [Pseudomonadota bacterium]